MKVFLSYIKSEYKTLIISAIFILWTLKFELTLFALVVLIFDIASGYNQYQKAKEQEKRLKAKGLTPEDAANIEFVKDWEATRQDGIWQYCFKDGGIIAGSFLSFVTSAISFWGLDKLGISPFAEPSDMFRFIGLNFLAGALIGIVLFRFKWNINEKKFIALTDPLNLHFSTVKELL